VAANGPVQAAQATVGPATGGLTPAKPMSAEEAVEFMGTGSDVIPV